MFESSESSRCFGSNELDKFARPGAISAVSKVENRRRIERCLVRDCLINKGKPVTEPPGVKGVVGC